MTTAVIAFSGGLDTSFLALFCREAYNVDKIITCTVNTGGFDEAEQAKIAARSKEVKADKHIFIDGAQAYYDEIIKYMVFGHATRDGYPLSVSSERPIIAKYELEVCKQEKADMFINGSTGAGSDQYRFDIASQVLGQGRLLYKSPVREFEKTREFETQYLLDHGVTVEAKNSSYSYNVGLWGISIGGKETHASDTLIPEAAWYNHPDPAVKEGIMKIAFEKGVPMMVEFEGEKTTGSVAIIRKIIEIGNRFGIGRHHYMSTTNPGKKGRIAFESPAADILYKAHRTLEALVMTQDQMFLKDYNAGVFSRMLHEAKTYDPTMDDLKAYLTATQRRVTGVATVYLKKGYIEEATATSPYDLLAIKGTVYGEMSTAYSGRDAEGSAKLAGYEQYLYHTLEENNDMPVYLGAHR